MKDSLNNLGSSLDNSISKVSKSIHEQIDKLYSVHNSGQLEDLNRERQRLVLPPVIAMEKGGLGLQSYLAIQTKRE